MRYNQLDINRQKKSTRVARGISAGKGKTAGRGTKGQNSRSGGGVRLGFEGGQNPLVQRLPKLPGFRSIRPKAVNIKVEDLANFDGDVIDNFVLFDKGMIVDPYVKIKLIGNTPITTKLTVKVQSASRSAKNVVEQAGGQIQIIERPKRQAKSKN